MSQDTMNNPVAVATADRRILAIAGSLRRESWNRRVLEVAAQFAPAGFTVEVYRNLGAIPMFDEDLERDTDGGPEPVRQLRDQVASADALLIATPEYNQSMPGVLKNAIDWLSRGSPVSVLAGKPAAVIGATIGPWGTRLAQHAVRQTLAATGTVVMPTPMAFLAGIQKAFDADGRLADARSENALRGVMGALARWMESLPGQRMP